MKAPQKKRSIGFVGMPFAGVPHNANLMSISSIIHRLTPYLVDDYDVHIVGGKRGRDPSAEIPGAHYYAIESWGDKLLYPLWSDLKEWSKGLNRHAMDREAYTPFFAKNAAKILAKAKCDAIFLMQFPQWLEIFRFYLPDARIFVWLEALHNIEEVGEVAKQLEAADGIICCSDAVHERVQKMHPQLSPLLATVPNAMNENHYYPPASDADREFSIFHSGRLVPYKGTHLLVDAFVQLAERYPDLRLKLTANFNPNPSSFLTRLALRIGLTLFGAPGLDRWRSQALSICDDAYRSEVKKLDRLDYRKELIRRAGRFADRIDFIKPVKTAKEMGNHYRNSTVFVHPAIWFEAFGMGVIEAMACGAPVVTTDCGGPAGLVKSCKGGLVVNADARSIAEGIEKILQNQQLAEQFSKDGAVLSRQNFTWRQSAKKLFSQGDTADAYL